MPARSRMTMRCRSHRNVDSGDKDGINQPITDFKPILTSLPCYWQVRNETFIADGDKLVAKAVHRMILPLGSDVEEQDVISDIRNRRGRTIKEGQLHIKSVLQREDHLAAVLEEYD